MSATGGSVILRSNRRIILPGVAVVLTMVLAAAASAGGGQAVLTGIFGTIAVAAAVRSVRLAWALYFLSICLTGVTTSVGSATVRPEHFGLALLFIVSARAWPSLDHSTPKLIPVATLVISGAFVALAVVTSAANAPDPLKSIWIALQIALGIVAYFALTKSSASRLDMVKIGTVVIGCIAALSVVSYLGRTYLGLPASLTPGVAADSRLIGFSFETNIFATQCVGWLAVMYCWRQSLSRSSLWGAGILVLAVALAGTRSAWIGLGILIVVMVATKWRRSPAFIPIIAATAAVSLLAVALLPAPTGGAVESSNSLSWRLGHLLDTQSGTGAYRADIFKTALADIDTLARWLFGSGLNSFSQFHERDTTNTGRPYLSSVWYAMLYDVGLVGLVLFVVLLVVMAFRNHRRLDAFIVLSILLVCSSATNSFWMTFTWIYLALIPLHAKGGDSPEPRTLGISSPALEGSSRS